jgi:hypothetical protein
MIVDKEDIMDIRIKSSLNEINNKYQGYIIGKKEDNIISYQEEEISVALILESDKITLSRETQDYKIELSFDKEKDTNGKYLLKEKDTIIPLKIKTTMLDISDNKIILKYTINTKEEESHFVLEYEVL